MKKEVFISIRDSVITNPAQVRRLFDSLADGRYLLTVESKKKRSLQQNKYYWAVVVELVRAGIKDLGTDLTKEETHELLKLRCNSTDIVNMNTGECIQVARSTADLLTTRFIEYIEKIQRFASEFLGIYIPSPNEELLLNFENDVDGQ